MNSPNSIGRSSLRFSLMSLIRRSLFFNFLPNLAVIASIAVATAVIVGAFLVGDSVRGSLRFQALDRLGGIDGLLLSRHFLEKATLDDWRNQLASHSSNVELHGFILFPRSTVETGGESNLRRAGSVLAIGTDDAFWKLSPTQPSKLPQDGEAVVNTELAQELNLKVGDELTLRIPAEQAVPADSPLGRREGQTVGIPRIKVVDIIPATGLGRFDIRSNQRVPKNIFVSARFLQEKIDQPGATNAIAVSLPRDISKVGTLKDSSMLSEVMGSFKPSLADLGLMISHPQLKSPTGEAVYDYYSLSSNEMILDATIQTAVMDQLPRGTAQPIFTYLANSISKLGDSKETVYSTITGADSSAQFPISEGAGIGKSTIIAKGQTIINSWLASQLNANVGDRLKITYYLPETVHGKEVEESIETDVVGIAPLTEPASPYRRERPAVFDKPPTIFNDPNLTPEVPGITDQDSINDWDTPFTLTREVSADDDRYWNEYRLTPKLIIPYAEAAERFGSRFGKATSIRIDLRAASTEEELREKVLQAVYPNLAKLGYELRPIKAEALAAASGTTPFDGLFLGLSMLVIGSALMLIALLFRLGIERRAEQWGLYLAIGWTWKRVRSLLLGEGIILSILGGLIGIPLGIFYARMMLAGLKGWWVGAVTVPFLQYYSTPRSLAIGATAGILVALIAIYFASRKLARHPATELLKGNTEQVGNRRAKSPRWLQRFSWIIWFFGLGLAIAGLTQRGQAQAGMFVGGGMVLLIGALGVVYSRLLLWQQGKLSRAGHGNYSLASLSARNIGRNPLRSTLTLGLLAVTSFLILSLSAFQIRPTEEAVGGFQWIGESSSPIFQNLGDPQVRSDYLGKASEAIADAKIFAFKMRPGDEASCNNLYKATEPKIIAASSLFAEWEKSSANTIHFPWISVQTDPNDSSRTAWEQLQESASGTQNEPIPVVLDQNTAMWSLHLTGGIGEIFSFEFGNRKLFFKTIGLLNNSLLQGMLVIGETNFQNAFPDISGYQFFLARENVNSSTPSVTPSALVSVLEKGWGDEGLDLVDSSKVLNQLLAVQNTYLKAFQSLGALGLLLGTIGLAIVQIRSVLERRSELATMRAIGFTPSRIRRMVFLENCWLLGGGILVGGSTAILCVAAPLWQNAQFTEIIQPLLWLVIVLVVGLLAGSFAVRSAGRQPLLAAIRQK